MDIFLKERQKNEIPGQRRRATAAMCPFLSKYLMGNVQEKLKQRIAWCLFCALLCQKCEVRSLLCVEIWICPSQTWPQVFICTVLSRLGGFELIQKQTLRGLQQKSKCFGKSYREKLGASAEDSLCTFYNNPCGFFATSSSMSGYSFFTTCADFKPLLHDGAFPGVSKYLI